MQSPVERVSRKSVSLRSRLLLATFGTLVGILLAEGILAVSGVVSLSPYEQDRTCGSRLKANYAGWQSEEGKVFVRTNSQGFRDREHSLAKPIDTIRIAVLGDSYCEAMQVDLNQTFWSVMEHHINDCLPTGSSTVEVLNTGVSGYGTAQELLTLQHRVWAYEPDVVLLCVLPANDIRNNSKSLEPDHNRPFYRLEHEQLVLDTTFLNRPLFASRWVRMKDQIVSRTHLGALAYRLRHRESSEPSPSEAELGLDNFIYQPPENESHQEAWRITERLLREIEQDVRRHDAKLVIVTIASGIQVHPNASVREAFATRNGIADLDYAERRIETVADGLGCLYVPLAKPMRAYAESHDQYLHGFENTQLGTGHWNAGGHRVAGEIIAEMLCNVDFFIDLAAP